MLSEKDLESLQIASSSLRNQVTIYVNRTGIESPFENNLLNIARQITGVSLNRVTIADGQESLFPTKPSFTLSDGKCRNIHYFAAPEGSEFQPFLEALIWLGQGKQRSASDAFETLKKLRSPTHLLIFIAAACPHCPQTVRSAISLATHCPLITLSVVDALEFPDLASRYKIKSTPTLIVDDGLTLVGVVTIEELIAHLVREDDVASLSLVLESMINSGRAEDAAGIICNKRRPDAIIPVYRSQAFSLRMGALVAMEEALLKDRSIFDTVIDEFTALLFQEDPGLRGDTAAFLGKTGNPAVIPVLRKIAAQDPDPDVQEAAQEALDLLEK